jgi:hypothetical protein
MTTHLILAGAWPSWLHWLESTFFPESGRWYALGSSWAGATAVFTGSIAFFAGYWRHHECHQDRCHRRGKFTHGHYKLCAMHHPEVPNDGKVQAHHIRHLTHDGQPRR